MSAQVAAAVATCDALSVGWRGRALWPSSPGGGRMRAARPPHIPSGTCCAGMCRCTLRRWRIVGASAPGVLDCIVMARLWSTPQNLESDHEIESNSRRWRRRSIVVWVRVHVGVWAFVRVGSLSLGLRCFRFPVSFGLRPLCVRCLLLIALGAVRVGALVFLVCRSGAASSAAPSPLSPPPLPSFRGPHCRDSHSAQSA